MRVFKIVLVSQALCLLACSGAPVASDAGGLAALTTQSEPKEAGNAVSPIALGDDFVLFAGGNGSEGADKTAFELINLSTLQYGQPPDRPHHVAGFSSVLLDESHLLVANNWDPSLRPRDPGEQEAWEPPATAAIWNLSTAATETTPAPTRGYFRADVAALPDGRVLVVGCAKDKESHAEIRDSATGE